MEFLGNEQSSKVEKEKKIVGVFQTEIEAMHAIDVHKKRGYSFDNISIIAAKNDKGNVAQINVQSEIKLELDLKKDINPMEEGLLSRMGVLAFPGIDPIHVTGPIVTKIMGADLDLDIGGVVGGLIEWS